MKPAIALIGPGRVGCAITKKLYEAGYQLTAVVSRDRQRATEACKFIGCPTHLAAAELEAATPAEIILIAVPDDQIKPYSDQLQLLCEQQQSQVFIHFSGLHPAAIMEKGEADGRILVSLHPLLPFADREKGYAALPQCPCAIESNDPCGKSLGEELVAAIGGIPFSIAANKKGLYHTAACISSNYIVTLIATARDLLVQCGIAEKQAIPLLLPLITATLDNVKEFGVEQGLTGPIVRGDSGTVSIHQQQLRDAAPEFLDLYRCLGKLTLKTGEKAGRLPPEQAMQIKTILGLDQI